ncbi:hypothetical protein BJV78DRAFT_1155641 [Lactifluus subvellereus]|nr:hypothetical protein BJV78DRAFT_1155641 [Lactifluus subvellereus]
MSTTMLMLTGPVGAIGDTDSEDKEIACSSFPTMSTTMLMLTGPVGAIGDTDQVRARPVLELAPGRFAELDVDLAGPVSVSKPELTLRGYDRFTSCSSPSQTGVHYYYFIIRICRTLTEKDHERVQFESDLGCKAMIYATGGIAWPGITSGFGGGRRVEYIIPLEARRKDILSFIMECLASPGTVTLFSHPTQVGTSNLVRPILHGVVLWPYHVTQQKVARSWLTHVDLSERCPEHRFACSSPQEFRSSSTHPSLSGDVLSNRWSWVENNANMVSDTYDAQALQGTSTRHHDNLESSSTWLLVIGNGDGAGGPLAKMLEGPRRLRGTADTSRELPVVHMDRSIDEFFDHLKTSSDAVRKLPNWRRELYLEVHVNVDREDGLFHPGTYASHGSIKKGNRKSEILLRAADHVATLASIFKSENYQYPKQVLDDSWEKVLLNQCPQRLSLRVSRVLMCIHVSRIIRDVLPGSTCNALSISASIGLAGSLSAQRMEPTKEGESYIVLYLRSLPLSSVASASASGPLTIFAHNTMPFAGWDVRRDQRWRCDVLQTTSDSKEGNIILEGRAGGGVAPPSRGWYHRRQGTQRRQRARCAEEQECTAYRRRRANQSVSPLFDVWLKHSLIPQGEMGGLIIFAQIIELRAAEVKIRVTNQSQLARVPSEHDMGHVAVWVKFADVSEYGYGVAILSESKYMFLCQGNVLRISLLRAATA